MKRSCAHCKNTFEIGDRERGFLESVSPVLLGKTYLIPPPTFCPMCRRQRRMAWRNERAIYQRQCDKCRKKIISMYPADVPYTVYCQDCFWSDSWTPLDYGRPYDFSRPFFEQFEQLLKTVPLVALINVKTENSEFCHRIFDGRNNYLSYIALYGPEDLIHTYYTQHCKDSIDISFAQTSELGYELVDVENCYHCHYGSRIIDCCDSYFLEDCIGCSSCFACKNLHHKSYHIFNEKHTKDQFNAFLREAKLHCWSGVVTHRRKALEFFQSLPSRAVIMRNSEDSTGGSLFHCKNVKEGYDLYECENLTHCALGEKSDNLLDCYGFGVAHHCYEFITCQESSDVLFSATGIESSGLLYCYECYANSQDCFGSVGLKKGRCCILNKEYSRDDYEKLLIRIIEHMRDTGEWGEFFPATGSPFSYNESVAQDDFPLARDQALEEGFRWQENLEPMPIVSRPVPAGDLPDSIDDIEDAIVQQAVQCKETSRPFRVVKQELDFYRRHRIPLPRLHPNERHRLRVGLRPLRRLWSRICPNCEKDTLASYPPERPEIVFCESCYLKTVF